MYRTARGATLPHPADKPYKIPKGSVLIDLTCGHSAWYLRPLPAPGSDAYCRDCDMWRRRKRPRKRKAKTAGVTVTPAAHPRGFRCST